MSVYTSEIAQAISDRLLHLIIMPTEQCNFRCVYCYESFEIGRMDTQVVQGVKSLLSNRVPTLDFLSISWFGGEPLLALDVMEEISEFVLDLNRVHPSLTFSADATTNAYFLTPDVFRKLLRWNIRSYQISFDGPEIEHDKKRILANGKGTFKRLWANLQGMKAFSESFAVTVRLHLDRDNSHCIPEFFEDFKNEFGDDDRFTLYVRELSQLIQPAKRSLNVFKLDEAMTVIEDARKLAENRGIQIRVPERKNHVCHAACYASKLNSFVIRANGHLSKCTVALDSDSNDIGILNEDGTLSLHRQKLLYWVRGLSSGDATELGCPMLTL